MIQAPGVEVTKLALNTLDLPTFRQNKKNHGHSSLFWIGVTDESKKFDNVATYQAVIITLSEARPKKPHQHGGHHGVKMTQKLFYASPTQTVIS
jgi:hypothetical protein